MSSAHAPSDTAGSSAGGKRWIVPFLGFIYTLALGWAYLMDYSPWVFLVGTLGAIGAGWGFWHLGHVVGHAAHSVLVQGLIVIAGAVVLYHMFLPVWEWRDPSANEFRIYMWFGFLGIVFLGIELGHMIHDHGWQTILGLGTLVLLVGLYIARPEGVEFTGEPRVGPPVTRPIAATPPPAAPSPTAAPPAKPAKRKKYTGPPVKKADLPDMF